MKYIIIGISVSISGIVLSIIEHTQLPEVPDFGQLERQGLSYKRILFPYLIPIGIFIAAIGFGGILSRQKKKKRNYYNIKSVL